MLRKELHITEGDNQISHHCVLTATCIGYLEQFLGQKGFDADRFNMSD